MNISPVNYRTFNNVQFKNNAPIQSQTENLTQKIAQVEAPLKEGIVNNFLEMHKNTLETIFEGQTRKINGAELILTKDGFSYYYVPSTKKDDCIVLIRGTNSYDNAFVHCDLYEDTYDYQFNNFELSKNFQRTSATIQKGHIEKMTVHKNYADNTRIVYEFNNGNKAKTATIINNRTDKEETTINLE